jgi:hypothetical protein
MVPREKVSAKELPPPLIPLAMIDTGFSRYHFFTGMIAWYIMCLRMKNTVHLARHCQLLTFCCCFMPVRA